MEKILIILFGSMIVITIIGVIVGVIIRVKNKKIYNKAYELLDSITKFMVDNIGSIVVEYMSKIDDNDEKYIVDGAVNFDSIAHDIEDYAFNKCSEFLSSYLSNEYGKNESLYKTLTSITDKEFIDNIVLEIKNNPTYVEIITGFYNKCFSDDITRIESEDVELEKEFLEYESAPIKEETQEQHNQSIEDYAKAHLNEKIKELNEVYDELEEEPKLKNVVPVRDLRALVPLIDDEEIIPPADEEPEVLEDDGTFEVVEYLDNINDNSLNTTNMDIEE